MSFYNTGNPRNLAGQFFHGCVIRTSANYPVELGVCCSFQDNG